MEINKEELIKRSPIDFINECSQNERGCFNKAQKNTKTIIYENKYSEKVFSRILVIFFGGIGDIVMSLPMLKALKKKYPNSNITYLTQYPASDLLNTCNEVSHIINISDYEINHQLLTNKLVSKLQAFKFDLAINLDHINLAANLASLSGSQCFFGAHAISKKII